MRNKIILQKQNNITEANKYFQIEQNLYLEELKKEKSDPNLLSTLIALYLNKYISHFGTDWVRSLLALISLNYFFMFIYIKMDSFLISNDHIKHFTHKEDLIYVISMFIGWTLLYLCSIFKKKKLLCWLLFLSGITFIFSSIYFYTNVLEIQNYIIQLINPVNAFKNMNLYEGIEVYGAFVRIVIITIIYQLIMAFRQNTRRK